MTWFADIYFVFWREMKRYFAQRARIITAVFQPLVWLVFLGSAMSGMVGGSMAKDLLEAENYLQFMTPGIMVMTALFSGMFSGNSLIWDRRIGFLNKMLAAPISRTTIPIGKVAAAAVQSMIQMVIIAAIAVALGVRFTSGPLGLVLMVLTAGLFCCGISAISLSFAVFIKTPEGLHPILNFLSMPLLFTSNAIFPRAFMPGWLQGISAVNPMTYAVTPMRVLALEGWRWESVIPGLLITLTFAMAACFLLYRLFEQQIG